MAEDLDIIELWEKGKKLSKSVEIDVDKAIRSKSKNTLYWLRLILSIEFTMNVACIPLFYYLFIHLEKDYLWGSIALVITIGYLFYYWFLIQQTKKVNYHEDVKTSLQKTYNYLHFFVMHYKVVIWISMFVGLAKGLMDVPNEVTPEQMATPNFWPITIAISVVIASLICVVLTLLISLLYGRKIKRLKQIVKEFTTTENELR